ncbi:MAG: hypothetical protein A2V62_07880 [Nitrospirae bacterium RBG_19FT_COMBO_58_9]|nr:MAG: hypothetical protein A2V62_07880 [Nitrospirae bacterium RBG_19FT_COMBO_58_9]
MEIDCAIVKGWSRAIMIGPMSLVLCSVIGACASDVPKSPPPPTDAQVRGHADRAFEKLKQEEQERSAQPPVLP